MAADLAGDRGGMRGRCVVLYEIECLVVVTEGSLDVPGLLERAGQDLVTPGLDPGKTELVGLLDNPGPPENSCSETA